MDACVFCRVSLKNGEEITQLREKGCDTVNRASQIRNGTIDSKAVYPSFVDINSEQNIAFVPDSLQKLLRALFSQNDSTVKVASVGQAIIQASRPRTLTAPLQITLSVQMQHHFGS